MKDINLTLKDGGLHVVSGGDPFNSEHISPEPICVNSCGYNYYGNNEKRVTILRPHGRMDYQLIYIQKGAADFFLNGNDVPTVLEKGSLILYKPGETQHYSYYTSCSTVAYWIHFTGTQIETLLRQNDLWDNCVYQLEDEPAFPEITMRLLRELQFRSYNYMLMSTACFQELICIISRNLHRQHSPAIVQYEAFIPAIELMHNEYQTNRSVEEYAALSGMSPYYFIRKFKEYTGYSPHTYLIRLRMDRARDLLLSSTLSVSEISFSVGYDNPLYFSRLFRKYTGSSPTEFRDKATPPPDLASPDRRHDF